MLRNLCVVLAVAAASPYLVEAVRAVPTAAGPCPKSCAIDLERVVTLRGRSEAESALLPEHSMYVTPAPQGGYVLPSRARNSLLRFDATGVMRDEAKGSSDDPFQLIANVLTGADGRLLAYDLGKKALYRLDERLSIVEAQARRYRPSLMLTSAGYLHAEQIPTAELVGYPMHYVDDRGQVQRSFGGDQPLSYRPDQPLSSQRVVANASRGTVLSVAPGRYVIERWNPMTGETVSRLPVLSSWFKPSVAHAPKGQRPLPMIVGLWEDDSVIWALLRDADANWKPRVVESKGERPIVMDEYDKDYDFVLEAIDPSSGRVLGSRRIDHAIFGQAPVFLLATRAQGQGGQRAVTVWKPVITQSR